MTLAHDVAGDGPTVVLLHSTVCDRRMWDPQVPALVGAGFRVVRCDLRGFGETPAPDGPYDDARDVCALLGDGPVTMVGASGGGRVALEVAARWRERVNSLVLLCTAAAGYEPSAGLRAFGQREEALLEAGDVAGATELNLDTWLGPDADVAVREKVRLMQLRVFEVQLAAGEEFAPVRVEADVSGITARTLLVSGEHDLVDFRKIAADLAGRISGAHHVELEWAGHLPSLERPAAVNELLVDFLRE